MGDCSLSVQEKTEGEGSGEKVLVNKVLHWPNSDLSTCGDAGHDDIVSSPSAEVSVGGGEVLQANHHQQMGSRFSMRPWRSRKIHSTSLWPHADWHTPLRYIHAQMKAYSMCMCAHLPGTWRKDFRSWLKSTGKSQVCLGMMQGTEDAPLSDLVILLRGESRVMWTVNCN